MNDITVDRTSDTTNRSFLMVDTDTLVKTLYDAIEYEWSTSALEVIIAELCKKHYKYEKLVNMIENRFGKPAALKVIRIAFNQ